MERGIKMDSRVLQTQEWLNNTYSGISGFTTVDEDGVTGTSTFTALIKALQIELGVTVDGDFGSSTLTACPATISQVPDVNTASPCNLHYIIQGSFWCKGYNPGGFNGIFGPGTASAVISFQADAGITQNGVITPYILQAIMNTDSYTLASNGDVNIQSVQTGLNSRYGMTFGLSPTCGIWDRVSQKNLIKSLQTECGVAVDGSFGSGTLSACPTLSKNTSGYTNTKRILQWALCVNGYYPGGFTGTFGTGTYNAVVSFQTFFCLTADGIVGKNGWGALMKSSGDTSRSATACDCATIIDAAKASTLYSNGYRVIGRYLTGTVGGTTSKALTSSEIQIILNAGLRFFPIYEDHGTTNSYFTSNQGAYDAYKAIVASENLGLPSGTFIYFSVDYDAIDSQVTSNVIPYFQAIKSYFDNYCSQKYKVGIYGARNLCNRVCGLGYAVSSFVLDMSTGYSGNYGYKLPTNWAFDQFVTVTIGSGSGQIQIDKDSYSGRDTGVIHVNPSANIPAQYNDPSAQPNSAICSDPVDTSIGAHILQMTALKVKGAQDISFDLSYNSAKLSLGTMGKGWSHNYEIKITKENNALNVFWTPSNYSVFTLQSNGTYKCTDIGKQNHILTVNSDGSCILNCNNDIKYSFNSNGQLTNIENRVGMAITISKNSAGDIVVNEPISGKALVARYNSAGFVESVSDDAGRTVLFNYDSNACLTMITDANGHTTTYTYDSLGHVLTGTDNEGICCFTDSYDSSGRIISQKDAITGSTPNNNKISKEDAIGNITTYSYDAMNRLISTTDANIHTSSIGYDAAGRAVSQTDALGNTKTISYDSNGNITQRTDALNNVVSHISYDSSNLPISVENAMGNVTTNIYDSIGRLTQTEDPLSHITSYSYDASSQLVSVTDALNHISSVAYDDDGNKISVTNPLGGIINTTYDTSDRIASETTVSDAIITYGYNAINLLSALTNARSQQRVFTYDEAGRVAGFTDTEGTTTFTYDSNGNVLTVNDSEGIITREFDALNRVTTYADTQGNVIQYVYDAVGDLLSIEYPDGKIVSYAYDASNRLISVTDWANRVTSYTYDANGNLIGTLRPDGSVLTQSYDDANRLISSVDKDRNNNVIIGYSYTYNANGRMTAEVSSLDSTTSTMVYDALSRLTDKSDKDVNNNVLADYAYVYDANGNMTSGVTSQQTAVMTYDNHNKLSQYNSNNAAFDLDGNMTQCVLGGNTVNFSFDSGNRLLQAGGAVFAYDANDNCISSTTSGNETQFVYENVASKLSNLLVRTQSSGNHTFYVYGIGLIGHQDLNGYCVYHYDFRGSTVVLTDTLGAVADRYTYGAYGELLTHTGTIDTPFLYNGRDGVMIESNGLYYMRARYYSPELKRFINADSKKGSINDSKTLNLFAFAKCDPVIYVDPQGQYAGIDDLIMLGVGAVVGVATTFASDLIANALTGGQGGFSDWQTYVGSAVGGAVSLELAEYTGPFISGAAGGATSYTVTQLLEDATGKSSGFNAEKLTESTIEGGAFGKFGDLDIGGITGGRNSFSAVFKSGITKLNNGSASKMSIKVMSKGFVSEFASVEPLAYAGKDVVKYYTSNFNSIAYTHK